MCFRPAEIQMKKCPECGVNNTPVSKVCKECGAELPVEEVDYAAQQAKFMEEANRAGASATTKPAAPKAPGAPKPPDAPNPQ